MRGFLLVPAAGTGRRAAELGRAGAAQRGRTVWIAIRIAVVRMQLHHAGCTFIRSRYDDGGYSGGSTDRPDLQRLLNGATKMPSGLRASRRARLVLRMDRGKPRKSSPSSAKMSKA